ncbi:unnamed protein product [Blepharisma stoltei]|uniref:Transcription elongation factor SPT5 n=1 Tax=Blepharisma stoltei TaxID=1481888 RepID=A0AAU9IXA3_9CILI|nr:unnamed protein product [Blepharisma stoltei]
MSDSESSYEDSNVSDEDYEAEVSKKRSKKSSARPTKRLKKTRFAMSKFIDDAAESGDEEESDVDSEFEAERVEAEKLSKSLHKKRNNAIDTMEPEEIARELERRVHRVSFSAIPKDLAHLSQQQQLPSIEDPKLWLVACRSGKEREAAINLIQKALQRAQEGYALEIFSVFASNYVRDYIYVEAYKKAHVITAVKGIHVLFDNRISIVPIEEMVDVFSMDKSKKQTIEQGMFVRVKNGDYKGDLAQIVLVEEHRGKATVKLVPRLEKTGNKKIRPPAKLFNPNDYRDYERKRDTTSHELYFQWNGMSFHNGFLYKTVALRSLQIENVSPSLTEIQIFQINNQEDLEDQKAPIIQARKILFVQGDKVRVTKGDVKGLTGIVISSSDGMASIAPFVEELCDQQLDFPIDDLSKFFEIGDHVKVISGRYQGITGMVAASKESSLDMICDVSKNVITVLSNDLKLSDEVSCGNGQIDNLRVNDIVCLNNDKAFGLVLKVDRDCIKAIMDNGETRTVWSHEIARKFNPNKASVIDRDGNTLKSGDMVKVTFARHERHDKSGSVRNALRGILFLYMPDSIDSNCIIPIKASYCILLGSDKNKPQTQGVSKKEWVGKAIRLTAGPYRGYTGKIIDLIDKRARVELNTISKTITVDIEICAEVGSAADGLGLQAPQDNLSRTPAHSPGYPMGTPAHDIASPWGETPRHDPFRSDWARSPSAKRF